jgi:uncharacterized membrane protein YgdD (TMEM256/DUF423 family)
MTSKLWISIGAISAAIAVGLGAYHAHGLEKKLAERISTPAELEQAMQNFEVAVRYQMLHAIALVVIGVLTVHLNRRAMNMAGILFVLGTFLFSGCLYVPVLTGVKLPWYLVPAGGLSFICGWIALAVAPFLKLSPESQ